MSRASKPTSPEAMQTPAGVRVAMSRPLTVIATPIAAIFAVPIAANARARTWSGAQR